MNYPQPFLRNAFCRPFVKRLHDSVYCPPAINSCRRPVGASVWPNVTLTKKQGYSHHGTADFHRAVTTGRKRVPKDWRCGREDSRFVRPGFAPA
jgi:hypothetical protein